MTRTATFAPRLRADRLALCCAALAALAACDDAPGGIDRDAQPFDTISTDATVTMLGSEPSWQLVVEPSGEELAASFGGEGGKAGRAFRVVRFSGNNGIGFSGQLDGNSVQVAVTPGECVDATRDAIYPYTATLALGDQTLYGCAFTDAEPFMRDAD
jgi:uncharacterized membrane protein